MKIGELLESNSKPTVFVDMDGVIADLYTRAADLHDVDHYNDMTPQQWETFFQDSDAYHLFRDIPPFPSNDKLINLIMKYAGGYTILSSPLSFDKAGSIKGKREWLKKHLSVAPDNIIFEHDKWKYAVQPDGTPNILIDDYGVNTRAWSGRGGVACKFQADEDSLDKVEAVLQTVFKKDK